MTTLTIYDTILVPRPVEIPDACPNCQASFRHGANLAEWDLTEVQYQGDVQGEGYLVDSEDGRGDDFNPVAYVCRHCSHTLAEATKREVIPSEATAPVMALLSSPPVPPSI